MKDDKTVALRHATHQPAPASADRVARLEPLSANDSVFEIRRQGTVSVFCKRVFDVIFGSLALVLLSPLFALIAILIKLDSAGPVFFRQERHGCNRRSIAVYKFRTMYPGYSLPRPTTATFIQARKDDPRVTRIGALLRRSSLDELPQLFNVVCGSMSLVGPRPHPKPLDHEFEYLIPTIHDRYAIKPGITGLAQVNGFRGETRRLEDMVARVELDLHYIRTRSLWLDLKILVMTAIRGWAQRNAY